MKLIRTTVVEVRGIISGGGGVEWVTEYGHNTDSRMTSWLRHNDVTEDQKYSLTESRLETETKLHNLEKYEPGIFLFLFQAMKGNFLTFACWKILKKIGKSSLLGMEIAAVINGNTINKRCFHLPTLKWMRFYLLPFDTSDLYWCVIFMDKISLKLPSFA